MNVRLTLNESVTSLAATNGFNGHSLAMSYVEFPALCCQDGRYSQYEGEYEINVQVLLVCLSKLRLSSHKREDTLTLLP